MERGLGGRTSGQSALTIAEVARDRTITVFMVDAFDQGTAKIIRPF